MANLSPLRKPSVSAPATVARPSGNDKAKRKKRLSTDERSARQAENQAWLQAMARGSAIRHEGLLPKLEVSEPSDPLEREADEIADRVAGTQTAPTDEDQAPQDAGEIVQRACAECAGQVEEEDEPPGAMVQREPSPSMTLSAQVAATSADFGRNLASARAAGGEALPSSVREFMDARFGQDFESVRLHRDARANELAGAVDAKAFTVGRDVFFREGQFQPESDEGKRLIAHELAHVVQQRNALEQVGRETLRRRESTDPERETSANLPVGSHWLVRTPRGGNLRLRVRPTHLETLPEGEENTVGNLASGTPVTIVRASDPATEATARKAGFFAVQGEVTIDGGQKRVSVGFVHRKFLVAPATKESTATPITLAQVEREAESLLERLEEGGEAAFQEALRTLEARVPAPVFVQVTQAVDARVGPDGAAPRDVERKLEMLRVGRNVVGTRAPGLALPLVTGAAEQLGQRLGAFGRGLVAGLKESGVSEQDISRFASKLALSQVINAATFHSIFMAGAAKGVIDDVTGTFALVRQLFADAQQVLDELDRVIRGLLNDDAFAFALGKDVGQNFGQSFQALSNQNPVAFSFELGRIVGPALLAAGIAVATGGTGLAASLASRLPTFLKTLRALSSTSLSTLGARFRPRTTPDLPAPKAPAAPSPTTATARVEHSTRTQPAREPRAPAEVVAFDAWERSINQQTRDLLQQRPELRDALRRVDPTTRRILTKCASPCIPGSATPDDISRAHALLSRVGRLHPAQELLLREYFFARRNAFGTAITNIEKATSPKHLEKLLKDAAAQRAARFEELARRHRGLQEPPLQAGENPNAPGTFFPGEWGDPAASPYRHARNRHGAALSGEHNFDRARSPGRKGSEGPRPQGQWLDDRFIVEAERRAVPANVVGRNNGRTLHRFDMGHPVGRVFLPDGTIMSDVKTVLVLRNADGTFFDAFPVIDTVLLP